MGASRPNSASGTLDPAKTPDAVDTPAAASSIMQNEDEKAPELTPTKSSEPPPHLEGFKVFLVILATSFIMLLATLDISIMSTVGGYLS